MHSNKIVKVDYLLESISRDDTSRAIENNCEPLTIILPMRLLEQQIERTDCVTEQNVIIELLDAHARNLSDQLGSIVYDLSDGCGHVRSPLCESHVTA
jgi:hypothetical protein